MSYAKSRVEFGKEEGLWKIREKQISRIISHLTPVLDSAHPPPVMVFGPTGSGKTVTLIHILSTFQRVAVRKGIKFRYCYIDLTSPKTFFGALNEGAIALDSSNRKYRKGIPIDHMQSRIVEGIGSFDGLLCLLIDEADNLRPNAKFGRGCFSECIISPLERWIVQFSSFYPPFR